LLPSVAGTVNYLLAHKIENTIRILLTCGVRYCFIYETSYVTKGVVGFDSEVASDRFYRSYEVV